MGADLGDVSPRASFEGLPRKHILTLRMDVPEPWNVQSARSVQDADNLRCGEPAQATCGDAEGSGETVVEYTLKSLLAAGQCFDVADRKPPNGLQLQLTRVGAAESVDTLVRSLSLCYHRRRFKGGCLLRLQCSASRRQARCCLVAALFAGAAHASPGCCVPAGAPPPPRGQNKQN